MSSLNIHGRLCCGLKFFGQEDLKRHIQYYCVRNLDPAIYQYQTSDSSVGFER